MQVHNRNLTSRSLTLTLLALAGGSPLVFGKQNADLECEMLRAPRAYPTGLSRLATVFLLPIATDVDGDGAIDVLIGSPDESALALRRNNRFGRFGDRELIPVTVDPLLYATDDLNGDGNADLVVAGPSSPNGPDQVEVLLGTGDGSFSTTGTLVPTNTNRDRMALGDFDGDGNLDLLLIGGASPQIHLLFGDGQGALSAGLTNSSVDHLQLQTMDTGDIDGDGDLDLAYQGTLGSGSEVGVLYNDGSGVFAPGVVLIGSPNAYDVTLLDLTGDGNLDVMVSDDPFAPISPPGTLTHWHGNGDGTFASALTSSSGGLVDSIYATDLDGDGQEEITVCGKEADTTGLTAVRNNVRTLGWQGGALVEVGNPIYTAAIFFTTADIDGDAAPDLIGSTIDELLIVHRTGITGSLMGVTSVFDSSTFAFGTAPVDFRPIPGKLNGDAIDDIVFEGGGSGGYSIAFGRSKGLFGPPRHATLSLGIIGALDVCDIDSDGFDDIVGVNFSSNISSVFALFGDGTGSFGTETVLYDKFGFVNFFEVVDLNLDGVLDVVAGPYGAFSKQLRVLLGTGQRSLTLLNTYTMTVPPTDVVAGDWNADGIPDLAVPLSGLPSIQLMPGDGTGNFGTSTTLSISNATSIVGLFVDDFDADGLDDLVVASSTGNSNSFDLSVEVHFGDGSGSFTTKSSRVGQFHSGSPFLTITSFDVDGDTHLDIMMADRTGALGVLLNTGVRDFQEPLYFDAGLTFAGAPQMGDWDRDGQVDFLIGGRNGVSLLPLNDCATCQDDIGFAGPGQVVLSLCGDPLENGGVAELRVDGAAPNSLGYLVGSASLNPTPLFGGMLVPVPIQLLIPVVTDSAGSAQLGSVIGQGLPFSYYAQAGLVDPTLPGGIAFSNALRLDFLP